MKRWTKTEEQHVRDAVESFFDCGYSIYFIVKYLKAMKLRSRSWESIRAKFNRFRKQKLLSISREEKE